MSAASSVSSASSVSTSTAIATTAAVPEFKKISIHQIGGKLFDMDIDQNTTISNLMQSVQKFKNWHVDIQQPILRHKGRPIELLKLPSDTRLVTLDLASAMENGLPVICILIKSADPRFQEAYKQLQANYKPVFSVPLEQKPGSKTEYTKLFEELKSIHRACEAEVSAKISQFPNKKKFISANPEGDWYAHVKSDAHRKEWDALLTKEFLHPSPELQARMDAYTLAANTYMAKK